MFPIFELASNLLFLLPFVAPTPTPTPTLHVL